ncbi:MAG: Tat pathway signal sequence, partial [Eggerthellaceae bacterium]|nr:Tat pathway signal sequence [Eggerthellaceae bacterium]
AIKKANTYKWLARIPLAVLAVGLIGGLLSFTFIPGNAKKYASILPIETLNYVDDIDTVNYTEIPVIDRDTAAVLGNKEMGAIADYVSQFEVSDLYSQINFQGTPVRVSPLNYADLIKWLFNRSEGIPAYVLVDMTTQDAKIVRISDVDGTVGAGIKYSQSEPLARNIERYVQLRYPFYMFDAFAFEIDENGHPWWICPVQTRTIGLFGGTDISRVILCDAVTGETFDYKIDEVPQWVDRAYPSDLLIQQYNWYGSYLNGWFNSWLGQSGVTQTTPGTAGELGYNYIAKDDDVWVYTGVTSATSDASIVGFILINQRTQEAHFYPVVGATETVAMQSAEGQVQHLKYRATFPILINVADTPTYFIALRDGAGLVKKFAMIDIQSYQRVAVGDTVLETQQTYIDILRRDGVISGDDVEPVVPVDTISASGTIARMTQVVVGGYSHFYVMLEGDAKLYDFPLPGCVEIVMYREGDSISFAYAETDGGYVAVAIK